ncbi:MAG: polyamine aminopropyltransferase [Planctomycetes bacterium]|nr:polyamine aminopropyltransferase [Planctomycetota bacterium]
MNRAPLVLLYLNVLIIATCGLVYELLAGTLASYLLGDSVTQFSLVIGLYLSAMGAGAWVSRFVADRSLARCFIEVELGVALVGGLSAPLLFAAFSRVEIFGVVLYGFVFAIGLLVGLELPLLMRLLKQHLDFEDLVSRVLAFDYIGALLASLMFPIFLVPRLGLVRTSLLCGLLNAAVGLWGTFLLRPLLVRRSLTGIRVRAWLVIGLLFAAFLKAETLTTLSEEGMFGHTVIHAETTAYQRLVLTRSEQGFRLYLNGHLQFNSMDEYRYHEALVHPALSPLKSPRQILVLGGGDGLAVREILRYPSIESVTLVDLDPGMTSLADHFPPLAELSKFSLKDPRVTIINEDAFIWVGREGGPRFDAVVIDFPDPGNFAVGKLYTTRFYRMLRERLNDGALVSIQCTSPLVAPRSYWCIVNTLEAVGYQVRPYHAPVPTFGEWGFVLASTGPIPKHLAISGNVAPGLRFLNDDILNSMFEIPPDLARVKTETNQLNNQALVRYYDQEWGVWK